MLEMKKIRASWFSLMFVDVFVGIFSVSEAKWYFVENQHHQLAFEFLCIQNSEIGPVSQRPRTRNVMYVHPAQHRKTQGTTNAR